MREVSKMNIAFIAMDLMCFVLFGIILRHAIKRGARYVIELFSSLFFGMLLEELNVIISHEFYVYGTDFLIMIDKAPLCIGMGWAVIIYSVMLFTDSLSLPEYVKPFLDSSLALLIDLSMDAVAIRLGYWTWKIPLNDGWFGVPAGNFIGWSFVVLYYSLLLRFTRRNINLEKYLDIKILIFIILPFIGYGLLFSSLFVTMSIISMVTRDQKLQLIGFVILQLIFMSIYIPKFRQIFRVHEIPFEAHVVPLSFHITFTAALIITGIVFVLPVLLPISLFLLIFHMLLYQIIERKVPVSNK